MSAGEKLLWIFVGLTCFNIGAAAALAMWKELYEELDGFAAFLIYWLWWLVSLCILPSWLAKKIFGKKPKKILW